MRSSEVKRFCIVSIVGLLGLISIEILLGFFGLIWNPIVYWAYGIFFGWIILGAVPSINKIWNGRTEESNVLSTIYDWDCCRWKGIFITKNGSIESEYGETPDEAEKLLLLKLEEIGGY